MDGQLVVPVQLGTNRASVCDPTEALFVEWLRRYISYVVIATDDDLLSSLAAVDGTLPALDYSASGAGPSSDVTDRDFHRIEWMAFNEWTRVVTRRDCSFVRASRL